MFPLEDGVSPEFVEVGAIALISALVSSWPCFPRKCLGVVFGMAESVAAIFYFMKCYIVCNFRFLFFNALGAR